MSQFFIFCLLSVRWLAGDFMCRFVKYFQMLSLYASTFIIVTISLDRCIAILCPISRFDHHRLMRIVTTCAWVLSALFSIPQVSRLCYEFQLTSGLVQFSQRINIHEKGSIFEELTMFDVLKIIRA